VISGKSDKREDVLEYRKKINQGINEESRILSQLVTLKHTYKWLTENDYSVPEKLKQDLDLYEKLYRSTSMELSQAIVEWDKHSKKM
jgi:hypothetical protein